MFYFHAKFESFVSIDAFSIKKTDTNFIFLNRLWLISVTVLYNFVILYLQSTTRQLTECVDLLLKLDEPAAALCEEFLTL